MSDAVHRVRLVDVFLDEDLWQRGSLPRRAEWRGAIRDLIETAALTTPHVDWPTDLCSQLSLQTHALRWSLETVDRDPLLHLAIPRPRLSPMVDEYAQICAELGRAGQAPGRLEALDIAKRLVHDEAGEVLQGLVSPLVADHATGRRLFTLIVTVLVDTTALVIPPHRSAGPGRMLR